jgi:stage III sporulation protein AG
MKNTIKDRLQDTQDALKNKKVYNWFTKEHMSPSNVAIAILFGVGLIVSSNLLFGQSTHKATTPSLAQEPPAAKEALVAKEQAAPQPGTAASAHARQLEVRLEAILRTVEGVGNVRVMVTLAAGPQSVYAENVTRSESTTRETDSAGGFREQRQFSGQNTTLTITSEGRQQPVLIAQYEPLVEGVIISAQGAGQERVAAALRAAAAAVLGVDAAKVQVLRMTEGS